MIRVGFPLRPVGPRRADFVGGEEFVLRGVHVAGCGRVDVRAAVAFDYDSTLPLSPADRIRGCVPPEQ